eukprot:CAMPEP_0195065552 /NCGR_PEP_ID=MMETSP0448-20130528/11180_1 /TAXON_ID=66468 /ORGANISM="Heterocapsa triquestra, Strain CCMP 448" /LENGTH=169 /DNA_ID=CAMNT_0040096665 /DNA_START=106 /DNA_END=613 /DNA_ORIENTATION=+
MPERQAGTCWAAQGRALSPSSWPPSSSPSPYPWPSAIHHDHHDVAHGGDDRDHVEDLEPPGDLVDLDAHDGGRLRIRDVGLEGLVEDLPVLVRERQADRRAAQEAVHGRVAQAGALVRVQVGERDLAGARRQLGLGEDFGGLRVVQPRLPVDVLPGGVHRGVHEEADLL